MTMRSLSAMFSGQSRVEVFFLQWRIWVPGCTSNGEPNPVALFLVYFNCIEHPTVNSLVRLWVQR